MAGGRTHIAAIAVAAALLSALPAHAQDPAKPVATKALELNVAPGSDILNLSSSLDGALSDAFGPGLRTEAIDNPLFKSDIADGPLTYDRAFTTGGVAGLDLQLQPRAAIRFSDEEDSALVGAIVRIGEDLKAGEVKPNTWYLFAGADAEAMHYTPGGLTRGEFAYGDRVIVGDAQAGIGYRMGDADVSVGYYHREVSSIEDNDPNNDFSLSEDAAAISFTWRR